MRIEELHTSVHSVGANALLTPEVLARIVAAVKSELKTEAQGARVRDTEHDLRSVVERQRAPLGGPHG
ncbi:MAG: hypothetical protein ABI873_19200 [Marmoricola sp.]